MAKTIIWYQPERAYFSVTEGKTDGGTTYKQATAEGSWGKGLQKHGGKRLSFQY